MPPTAFTTVKVPEPSLMTPERLPVPVVPVRPNCNAWAPDAVEVMEPEPVMGAVIRVGRAVCPVYCETEAPAPKTSKVVF